MNEKRYFEFVENVTNIGNDELPYITFNKNGSISLPISEYFNFLSSIEEKELLNILNYSKKSKSKYSLIDKDIWLKYKIYNNITISPITEIMKKGNYKPQNDIFINYNSNRKNKDLEFSKELYDKPKPKALFDTFSNLNYDKEPTIYIHKISEYSNNIELLYLFLNCLFNSNHNNLFIKKCDCCKKYYLTNKRNKKYCNREKIVCGIETDCLNSLNTLYQSAEYMKIRRMKDNHLSKYYKTNDEESINYINMFMISYNQVIDNCKEKRNIDDSDIKEIEKLIS